MILFHTKQTTWEFGSVREKANYAVFSDQSPSDGKTDFNEGLYLAQVIVYKVLIGRVGKAPILQE